jgi:hypothetical protein
MEKQNASIAIIIGAALVVLAITIAFNSGLTGNVTQGPYKCSINSWPDRVLETGTGRIVENCPGERPYCDTAMAATGTPVCCRYCDGTERGYGCGDCVSALTEVQQHVA